MELFYILFFIMFFLAFGMMIYTFIRNIAEWNRNNKSPRLSVEAKIVDKRSQTTHHHHNHEGHYHTTGFTAYYVTFEVRSGDRMELKVPRDEYGLLAKDDTGVLSFQGTRYLGFERKTTF